MTTIFDLLTVPHEVVPLETDKSPILLETRHVTKKVIDATTLLHTYKQVSNTRNMDNTPEVSCSVALSTAPASVYGCGATRTSSSSVSSRVCVSNISNI